MLNLRLFRFMQDKRLSVPIIRGFHHEFSQSELKKTQNEKKVETKSAIIPEKTQNLAGVLGQKYTIFQDKQSPAILDIYEERERYQAQEQLEELQDDYLKDVNLKRGVTGVFDIEDMVDVLRKENAEDIFVSSVPIELKYVDYIVVCSGRSYRHIVAIAEFVRILYKKKCHKGDVLPRIEGKKCRHWKAMDLGNIALHIYSPKVRESYDLESLWGIGFEYDPEYNKPRDPLVELFEKHSTLLADFQLQK